MNHDILLYIYTCTYAHTTVFTIVSVTVTQAAFCVTLQSSQKQHEKSTHFYGESEVAPVLNQGPGHEGIWGNGGTAAHIINHGSRQRCTVSFML
jgi:hypothetical protein